MDHRALEKIQEKVESGAPLTEAEARAIEAAALSEPGPKWRLVLAHALINAELPNAALPMMESLVREAPTHPQTRLGLARALIALDRYAEAERVLKDALGVRPKDPEAMKALAVLALRRDERALAKSIVSEVLTIDPFDQEAQLIAAELDPASRTEVPTAVAIASEKAFREALLDALAEQGVSHLHRGAQLFVKNAGQVGRVDVRGLYDSYVSETRPLTEVVVEMARQLGSSAAAPRGRVQLLAQVRPVLRGADFVQIAVGALSRELSSELRLFYVLDDKELVRYLPVALVAKRGLSPEQLHEQAMKNLGSHAVELKRVRIDGAAAIPTGSSSGIVAVWEADGYDGARLLLPEVRQQVLSALSTSRALAQLGQRELCVLCSEADETSASALRALPVTDGIAGIFLLTASGLERGAA